MKKKLKVGSLYKFTFLDHTVGDSLVTCVICGWVVSQSSTEVRITYWWVEEEDCREGNLELVSLIRSAILEVVQIPH
jgi:hypothetical protein